MLHIDLGLRDDIGQILARVHIRVKLLVHVLPESDVARLQVTQLIVTGSFFFQQSYDSDAMLDRRFLHV